MGKVYEQVLKFKKKYPMTIAWRLKQNSKVIEKHLNPNEKPLYSFVGQKNNNSFVFWETAVVTLTTERILLGRKRLIFGYFLTSVTPDMFNDLSLSSGIIWGKVYIDTVKEYVTLSNLPIESLVEIETKLTTYMMKMKKEFLSHSANKGE